MWQRWQRFFRKFYYLKKDFIIFVKIRKNLCHRCHVATRWKLELLISFKKINTLLDHTTKTTNNLCSGPIIWLSNYSLISVKNLSAKN